MSQEFNKLSFSRAAEQFRDAEVRSNEIWIALHDTVKNMPRRSPSPTRTDLNESCSFKSPEERLNLRLELLLADVKRQVTKMERIHARCSRRLPSLHKQVNHAQKETMSSEIQLQQVALRVKHTALAEFTYTDCASPSVFRAQGMKKPCKM
jgi:hypothetical protein